MNKLTKKDKEFLYNLLNVDYALVALNGWASEDNNKEFKRQLGVSIKVGQKMYDKLLANLK